MICVHCDRPIVRGQRVAPGGMTAMAWRHEDDGTMFCFAKGPQVASPSYARCDV